MHVTRRTPRLQQARARRGQGGGRRRQGRGQGDECLLREIVFYDTPRFDLYESAFIVRQRTQHRGGWPVGDSELTVKFRHPDIDAAAKIDLRPVTEHDFRIKFKEEVLPKKGGAAGTRSLFSHKVVLTLPAANLGTDLVHAARVFPALRAAPGGYRVAR